MKRYYAVLIPFYTVFLVYMMLWGCGRSAGEVGNLQLRPFHTIHYFFSMPKPFESFFINIICNVLVFVPFGWLGWALRPMKSLRCLAPFFILSIVGIELIQHFSGRGMADIDDVILNTSGMLLGYFGLRIFSSREDEAMPQYQNI
ncbi:VanZ family protein [Weeksellaceae bacterium A-14]